MAANRFATGGVGTNDQFYVGLTVLELGLGVNVCNAALWIAKVEQDRRQVANTKAVMPQTSR